MPNMVRGPPGPAPPRVMMPGGPSGPKEPWGHGPSHGSRGWGEDPMAKPGSGWGDDPMKRDPSNWGNMDNQWKQPRGVMPGNIRASPSNWDDPGMDGGWGHKSDMLKSISKEVLWNTKQFRILCDMGFRKEDIESTLRATNLRLEDALEMLNSQARSLRPHNPGPPFEPPMDTLRGAPHFPAGPSGLGYPGGPGPGGMMPPGGMPLNSPLTRHKPQQQQQIAPLAGTMMPPQPPHRQAAQQQVQQQPSQPSTQQLRILVQQIQMAVQAGHLNPQILNQPLAPQTLLFLNQLLQQIKTLQGLQNQHGIISRTTPNSPQLMDLNMDITKTKQTIGNLQNQISAQQANYLKQAPTPQMPAVAAATGAPPESATNTMQEMLNGLNLMGADAASTSNGSRLKQWKFPNEFPKAPGAGPTNSKPGQPPPQAQQQQHQGSASTLLLDQGLWGNSGKDANGGGWPDNSSKAATDGDFGIPEFEPGKPWKGPGLKNPDEDPNLTPGSVAALAIGSLSKVGSSTSLAAAAVAGAGGAGSGAVAESSSLSLTSPTWSFGANKNDSPAATVVSKEAGWPGMSNGPTMVTSSASSNSSSLTQIGQDLWGGKSGGSRAPPGLAGTGAAWPPSSNGWSTGQSGPQQQGSAGDVTSSGSSWLLLKNLTPQIDGSTLKTLCMQHGPLQHFDLYLNHSIALVMYASGREAAKVNFKFRYKSALVTMYFWKFLLDQLTMLSFSLSLPLFSVM